VPAALIGIAEKGYLSLELAARGGGGHSSTPPSRTSIGQLSRAVHRVQQSPLPAGIDGPVAAMFDHLAPATSFPLRILLANRWLFGPLLHSRLLASPASAAMLRTTTAPTLFHAGVKDNVLPSEARAVVNFRILPGDSVEGVIAHVREAINDPEIEIRVVTGREPSPSADPESESYAALARSIREVFPDMVVAPTLVVGGTDSKHFVGVAENSFRFVPLRLDAEDLKRIHGTNERIAVENYVEVIGFFVRLLENAAG
jgi:carboxypeptidase PM20D1